MDLAFDIMGICVALGLLGVPVYLGVFRFRRHRTLGRARVRFKARWGGSLERSPSKWGRGPLYRFRDDGEAFSMDVSGRRIDIEQSLRTFSHPWTWVAVSAAVKGAGSGDVSIEGRVGALHARTLFGQQAPPSGDEVFDATLNVQGSLPSLVAFLNADRRAILLRLAGSGGRFRQGRVTLVRKGLMVDVTKLEAAVADAVEWARVLTPAEDGLAAQLGANALQDDLLDVRRKNLDGLILYYGHSEVARTVCEELVTHDAVSLRLISALHLGPAATQALLSLTDPAHPVNVRTEATGGLHRCPGADVEQRLLELLSAPSRELRRGALFSVGKLRILAARGPLLTRFLEADSEERRWMAPVLAELSLVGDADVTGLLLQGLEQNEKGSPAPFVRALGDLAGVDAVELLMKALAGGFEADGQARRAAKEAIRSIQNRSTLKGAEAGQVSLAGSDDRHGALSLKDE